MVKVWWLVFGTAAPLDEHIVDLDPEYKRLMMQMGQLLAIMLHMLQEQLLLHLGMLLQRT